MGTYTRDLANGTVIPVLGLGVAQIPNGPECVDAVRWALDAGYRHIDTAQVYGNEESVGRALRHSGVPREEVFVTTKFHPSQRDPVAELEHSLARLDVDYVDLYLVHWPSRRPTRAWPGMEDAHRRGLARSIGVSNFGGRELRRVLAVATIAPVVDQVQLSPFDYRRKLLDAGSRHNVVMEAYSPLGTGRHLSNPVVRRVASEAGRTAAQVLLRWCEQRDLVFIPKSSHRDRIEENARIFDFSLSDRQMAKLDALDRTGGTNQARERRWR